MELARKLQLGAGQHLAVVDMPAALAQILPGQEGPGDGDALLVFVADKAGLAGHVREIVEAASADRLTWVAYPKAGQLGTDLNRDSLAALLTDAGARPVRQVSLDDVWSALRFRPA